jgi:ABC-type multidrug transport system ATPase subunit
MLALDVSAGYRGRTVVEVSASVPPGATALVGPNGSGKTTLLRAVAGAIPARRRVEVDGRPLGPRDVAYLPHGGLDPNARVGDELEFYWEVLGAERRDYAVDLLGLKELMGRKVGELSRGQARRAELAVVLALRRRVYLLDEPLEGLDVQYRGAVLGELRRLGEYVIFTTHDPSAVEAAAGWLLALRGGRLAYSGPPSGLKGRVAIRARRGGEVVTVETDRPEEKVEELRSLGYSVEEVRSTAVEELMR